MPPSDSSLVRDRIPKAQFGRYLRTGSWVRPDEDVEVKFNPWHDPRTGRFTFKGGGPSGAWGGGGFTGGGGGGGDFRGAGASATWNDGGLTNGGGGDFRGAGATAHGNWAPDKTATPTKPLGVGHSATAQIIRASAAGAAVQTGAPWHSVERNGYTYKLDAADRTREVTGTLTAQPVPTRSRSAQASAGGADRLPNDDGGHYIAARFNGPTDRFNHFAQDANFNRGGYRVLESAWAKDIKAGKKVWVDIVPSYADSSRRPSTINVVYFVNGQRGFQPFTNSSKGKPHGK